MLVNGGAAAYCTQDEWSEAIAHAGEMAAPPKDLKEDLSDDDVADLERDSTARTLSALHVADQMGTVIRQGGARWDQDPAERTKVWYVISRGVGDGNRFIHSVRDGAGGSVVVRLVGCALGGVLMGDMTTSDDEGRVIPAYDDPNHPEYVAMRARYEGS